MQAKFEDVAPLIIFLSILFTLLGTAVASYFLLSSKKASESWRRTASWVAAAVSTLVALAVTMAFGIPILTDFRVPGVPFREALLGATVVWAICLCAWVIAMRCVVFALRQGAPDRESGSPSSPTM
jgi:hypothetical protein